MSRHFPEDSTLLELVVGRTLHNGVAGVKGGMDMCAGAGGKERHLFLGWLS